MYCWNPELYASSSSAQNNWGLELLTKLSLKGNERVLDAGCRDGRLSAEIAKNLEMNSKDMSLAGKESLFASIASTWHPFTQQVPESLKNKFIDEPVNLFVSFRPPDNKGHIHVRMIRLEIEAYAEK